MTARIIINIPQLNRSVRDSPKTTTPKKTAVKGSKAPKIAVGVEPIYCMAWVVQRNEIAVGKIAKAIRLPHKYQVSATRRLWPTFEEQIEVVNKTLAEIDPDQK